MIDENGYRLNILGAAFGIALLTTLFGLAATGWHADEPGSFFCLVHDAAFPGALLVGLVGLEDLMSFAVASTLSCAAWTYLIYRFWCFWRFSLRRQRL